MCFYDFTLWRNLKDVLSKLSPLTDWLYALHSIISLMQSFVPYILCPVACVTSLPPLYLPVASFKRVPCFRFFLKDENAGDGDGCESGSCQCDGAHSEMRQGAKESAE